MISADEEEGTETRINNFDIKKLSDNSLSLILEKLPLSSLALLSCTNKKMHKLCHNPQFWSSICINDASYQLTPYNIAVLCGKGSHIQNLYINCHFSKLAQCSLNYFSLSCQSIVSLSLFLSNNTSGSSPESNVFPIDILIQFLTNSKHVRSLKFVDSISIDDSHLFNVSPHLQRIREIDLSGCTRLSDSSLIKLAQQCPSLQLLDISRLSITGRCIEQIFRYCTSIQVLRVNKCSDMQSDSFHSVQPESLKNLIELSVIDTPVSLERTLQCCTNLSSLLGSVSFHDSICIPFFKQNRSLEVLHIGSGCKTTIASLLTAVQTCGWRLISLTFHPYEDFAVPSDDAIRLICDKCPVLKHLSLARTQEVSTYWVCEILRRLKLESLALFDWFKGNSSSLRLMIPYIGSLKMLCLTGCSKLKPDGVINFLSSCPLLRVLKLEESGANVPNGHLDPSIIDAMKSLFPNIKETSPGTLFLQ